MIVSKDKAPKYILRKHINDKYLINKKSLFDCAYETLTTLNNETFSAYTMILLLIVALINYYYSKKDINSLLILTHIILHTPFSIAHHCLSGYSKNTHRTTLKFDVLFIYISQTFVSFAMCYNKLPLKYTLIILLFFSSVSIYAINQIISKRKKFNKLGLKYIPIVLLHLIPVLYLQSYDIFICQFIGYIIFFYIYHYKYPESIINFNYINSNNIMHIGLIFNNIICNKFLNR